MVSHSVPAGTEQPSDLARRNLSSPSNMQSQRGEDSTHQNHSRHFPTNVGESERILSKVGGATLLLAGLSRGRLSGLLLTAAGGALLYRGMTGFCHLYDAMNIDTREHGDQTVIPAQAGVMVRSEIEIRRNSKDLYAFWRNLQNLPRVMTHLQRIELLDDKRSRWHAVGPMGKEVQWDAEIINEREPEMIAWRSLEGSDIDTAGSVHFKPTSDGNGTHLTVVLRYNPPGGKIGAAIAHWLGGDFQQRIDQDLQEFKKKIESAGSQTVS